jgi:hypothetical protein
MNQNWKEDWMLVNEPDIYDGNIGAAFEREQLRTS